MFKIKIVSTSLNDCLKLQSINSFPNEDLSNFLEINGHNFSFFLKGLAEGSAYEKSLTLDNSKAYLIKLNDDCLIGFILLKKTLTLRNIIWSLKEFYILAKYQDKELAQYILNWMWLQHPGKWEILITFKNEANLVFWRNAIANITFTKYKEKVKTASDIELRYGIFNFNIKLTINKGSSKDHEEIAKASIRCWQDAYKEIFPSKFLQELNVKDKVSNREYWYSLKNKFAYVARLQNKIIGFCDYGDSRHQRYALGEIYALYVVPEFKGYRIGERLIKAAMQDLAIKNFFPFIVTTINKNFDAQKFYQAQGFNAVGEVRTKIGGGYYTEIVYFNGNKI